MKTTSGPENETESFIDNDIAFVWATPDRTKRSTDDLLVALYRGDRVRMLERTEVDTKIRLSSGLEGWIRGQAKFRHQGLLELAFIDVGQGDSCLITTPKQRRILVDGGENKLAARYLASRYWPETSAGENVHFDAIIVTHGDADHLGGLSTLVLDAVSDTRDRKRIKIETSRVFHNGLVKRTSTSDRDRLGPCEVHEGTEYIATLDDPRHATNPSAAFKRWNKALNELESRRPFEIRALDEASDSAFSFLEEDVRVSVLSPSAIELASSKSGLPCLGTPTSSATSASQTINGHSLTLRLDLGNVGILLAGDLTDTAGTLLAEAHDKGTIDLQCEVLKVPHHGSADTSRDFLSRAAPIASIISSGDENASKDHLHPRANVLGLLGRADRGAEPVIFVTNLAAFDRWAGPAFRAKKLCGEWHADLERGTFYARERTAYGIVHVRTDGDRLLVIRKGARKDRLEPYSFRVHADGTTQALAIDKA